MMISNWKKPFGLHGLYNSISALYGLTGSESNQYKTAFMASILHLKRHNQAKIKKIGIFILAF